MPLVDLLGPLPNYDSVGQATPVNSPKHSPSSGEFQLDPGFAWGHIIMVKNRDATNFYAYLQIHRHHYSIILIANKRRIS